MTRLDGGMADPEEESSLERLLGSTLTEAQRELLRQMSASEELPSWARVTHGQELAPVLLTEEDRTLAAEFVAEQQRRLVADEERGQRRELAERWEMWEWSDSQQVRWCSTPPVRGPVTW